MRHETSISVFTWQRTILRPLSAFCVRAFEIWDAVNLCFTCTLAQLVFFVVWANFNGHAAPFSMVILTKKRECIIVIWALLLIVQTMWEDHNVWCHTWRPHCATKVSIWLTSWRESQTNQFRRRLIARAKVNYVLCCCRCNVDLLRQALWKSSKVHKRDGHAVDSVRQLYFVWGVRTGGPTSDVRGPRRSPIADVSHFKW